MFGMGLGRIGRMGGIGGASVSEWQRAFNDAEAALQANSGVLFLPLPGYMFQDTAGLIPAVVGQKVARLNCCVGSGKVAQQATSGAQPVLRQSAGDGPYYLDPNGENCYFVTDCTGSGFANITMIGHGATAGSGQIFAGCFKAPSSRSYFGVADGAATGLIGAGMDGVSWATLHAATGWAAIKCVSVTRSETQGKLYVDGVLADTETISGVGSELFAYLMAGNGDGVAFDFWDGPWFGLAGAFVTLADADREVVEAFFAANLIKNGAAPPEMQQWLTGDQRAFVTVTPSAGLLTFVAGAASDLVNGGTSAETLVYFTGGAVDATKTLEFGTADPRRVTEIRFYQANASSHGIWQIEAFDGSSWVAKGDPFTLGGAETQNITTLNANVDSYSSYRFRGASGIMSSSPYLYEFQFRVV